MDQLAREDIAAAAAAHRELGRDYDAAVAEGLIERIGEEIDKRVDARLGQRGSQPESHAREGQLSPAARPSWETLVFGLGSMLIGGISSAAVLNSRGTPALAALIWIVIGIINVSYARRR